MVEGDARLFNPNLTQLLLGGPPRLLLGARPGGGHLSRSPSRLMSHWGSILSGIPAPSLWTWCPRAASPPPLLSWPRAGDWAPCSKCPWLRPRKSVQRGSTDGPVPACVACRRVGHLAEPSPWWGPGPGNVSEEGVLAVSLRRGHCARSHASRPPPHTSRPPRPGRRVMHAVCPAIREINNLNSGLLPFPLWRAAPSCCPRGTISLGRPQRAGPREACRWGFLWR